VRTVWIVAICCLHVAAMWALAAIWTTCAGALLRGVAPPVLLALCAGLMLPLSTLGGTAALQPPLAVATLCTLALMIALLVHALWSSAHASRGQWGGMGHWGPPDGVALPPPSSLAMTAADAEAGGGVAGGVAGGGAGRAAVTAGWAGVAAGEAASFHALVLNLGAFGPAFSTFLFSFILQQRLG
jgi:hypothetical protein